MSDEERLLAIVKVYGNGRIQIPSEVRGILEVEDGDKILFTQIAERIMIKKVESERQHLGKYSTK